MSEIRTRALVLRCYDQRESDRMVHLYTESQGKLTAIAKGARRSRKRFPGTLEIFTLLEVRLADPPRSSMMRLEAARLVTPFEGLVNHVGRYATACLLLELLDRVTGEREANPDLFAFACGVLDVVREEKPDRLLALLVLAKTVSRLGYRPLLARCAACGQEIAPNQRGVGFEPRHGGAVCSNCRDLGGGFSVPSNLLLALEGGIRSPLVQRSQLGLSPDDVLHLELLFDRFIRFHLGLELRSAPFLRSALSPSSLDLSGRPVDNARAPATGGTQTRFPAETDSRPT